MPKEKRANKSPNLESAVDAALKGLTRKQEKAARTLYLTTELYEQFEKKCAQLGFKPSAALDALIAEFVRRA